SAIATSLGFSLTLPSTTVAVTIASSTAGLGFSITGAGCQAGSYTTPQVLQWLPGSMCTVTFTSPQNGAAGAQYLFTGWADGPTSNQRAFGTPVFPTTYTAQFQTQYLLTVAASPVAGGFVTGSGYQNADAAAPISATPNPGYIFSGWTGSPVAVASSA